MERWKTAVALTVVGAFVVGPVWAQTTMPDKSNATDKSMDKSGTMDKSATGTTDKTSRDEMKAGKGEMKGDMKRDRTARAGNREQVRAAQQALKDKGHDPGPIDGAMGPRTQAALKDFQKAQGLKETGRLDADTMAKLEMKTGAASSTMPSASPQTEPAKPADSAKPAESTPQPSASPSAPAQDSTKPADTTKPTEEKKQ